VASAIVQAKEGIALTSGSSIASASITVTNGNILLAYTLGDVDTTHTISDTLGTLTWTEKASCVNTAIVTRTRVFTANVGSSTTGTVTCTFGATQGQRGIVVYEISGTSGVDQATGLADTGNSPTSPAISRTPTAQPGLALAWATDIQSNTAPGVGSGGFSSFGNFWVGSRDGTMSSKSFASLSAVSCTFTNAGFDHCNQILVLVTDGSLGAQNQIAWMTA
jgi:hypothetical protein